MCVWTIFFTVYCQLYSNQLHNKCLFKSIPLFVSSEISFRLSLIDDELVNDSQSSGGTLKNIILGSWNEGYYLLWFTWTRDTQTFSLRGRKLKLYLQTTGQKTLKWGRVRKPREAKIKIKLCRSIFCGCHLNCFLFDLRTDEGKSSYFFELASQGFCTTWISPLDLMTSWNHLCLLCLSNKQIYTFLFKICSFLFA